MKIPPTIIEAIQKIPRQFYTESTNQNTISKNSNDILASLFVSRYRRVAVKIPQLQYIQPSSAIIWNFLKRMPEQKSSSLSDMIDYLAQNMLTKSSPTNQTIFIENDLPDHSSQQNMIMELEADKNILLQNFNWSFFKLNLFIEQYEYSHGFYLLMNQQVESIQKIIKQYYNQNLYSSHSAQNIYFLLKKDYTSEIVVLNVNGEVINYHV